MITLSLAEVRANLSRLIDSAVKTNERITVTRNGRPSAVIVSAEDFEALIETLDILSDADAVQDIAEAQEAFGRGEFVTLEAVTEMMRQPVDK
jgi:prevent-host-death family protein